MSFAVVLGDLLGKRTRMSMAITPFWGGKTISTDQEGVRSIDFYVRERVRAFLVRRHKVAGRGNNRFPFEVLHWEHGVLCLERLP